MHLVRDLGLLEGENVTVVPPVEIDDERLLTVHDPEYVAAVQRSSADPDEHDLLRGLGTDDVPTFRGMHEASRAVCGATLAAAQEVHSGRALHAVNLAGGLHHAMPGAAAGLLRLQRHRHRDPLAARPRASSASPTSTSTSTTATACRRRSGTSPRVLTDLAARVGPLALSRAPAIPSEVGGPGAIGSAVNVALPPGTDDNGWLRAFHGVVPQLVAEFAPQILVTQQGCDTHADDPLAHLALSVDGQRMTYQALHRLAHRVTGGKWIATGGGGYSWIDVVPRAWSHLVGEVVGAPVPPETPVPASWRDFVEERLKVPTPALMTDGRDPWVRSWEAGLRPRRRDRRRRAAHARGRLPLPRPRRRPLPRLLTSTARRWRSPHQMVHPPRVAVSRRTPGSGRRD